jgi:hypothetical protein
MATTNRGYAAASYGIELDGVQAGFLDDADGGWASADVVTEKPGSDGVAHKHIARVKYEDICIRCGTTISNSLLDAVKTVLAGAGTRRNGTIVEYDYSYKELSRLNFSKALITEIGFPALDAASKDAAYLTLKFTPETTTLLPGGGSLSGTPVDQKPGKKWLCSNFRLTIDGLDCSRVSKVECLTIRQNVAVDAVGGLRVTEVQPSALDIPNLVVTLAESTAQSFYDWHRTFVIEGKNGSDQEKSGAIEFLTSDLTEVLFRLQFSNLGIFRLTVDRTGGNDNVRRVRAEMYCEKITFSPASLSDASASLVTTGAASSTTHPPVTPKKGVLPQTVPLRSVVSAPVTTVQLAPPNPPKLRFRS